MSDSQIDREIAAFEAMRADLEKNHLGKHVIIKDGKLVGAFDTFDAAAREALLKFGEEPFMIRQVGAPASVRVPTSVAWCPIHVAG